MTHYKKIYGLTGGIASGKSTVASILKANNYSVVDMDKISREIFEINKPAYKSLIKEFGPAILDENKNVDRKALRELVFNDKEKLRRLNCISHPEIMKEARKKLDGILKKKDLVFIDIPLLFETMDRLNQHGIVFFRTILVYVDRKTQIERLMKRDDISMDSSIKIIDSQMDIERKKLLADIVINNLGNKEDLNIEIEKFLSMI